MCRNIRTLFNFDPAATDEEIRESALQFVRKLSGFKTPSKVNEQAFEQAVNDIAKAAGTLIASLQTNSPSKNRDAVAAKARASSRRRFQTTRRSAAF